MAVAVIQEFEIRDRSTTNYDAISERLRGGPPAVGLMVHTAGFDDDAGVFRIFDVWESRDQAEAFQTRVMELVGDMVPPDTPGPSRSVFYELHDLSVRQ
jgi:hypothetical protein